MGSALFVPAGINAERLASYDRPIRSSTPTFSAEQVPGLTEDLIAYRRTLAAVHSGADLSAAIDGVLGYDAGECKGKASGAYPALRCCFAAARHSCGMQEQPTMCTVARSAEGSVWSCAGRLLVLMWLAVMCW